MGYYELLLARKLSGGGGGGSSIDVEPLSVVANGIYTAPEGTAYSPVSVNVSGVDINQIADGSLTGSIVLTASAIQTQRFKGMTHITAMTAPNVTLLREQILNSCTGITSISFENATTVQSTQQFLGCTSLVDVNLPVLTKPAGNMFQGCTALEIIDFPKVNAMNVSRVFYGCTKLSTIILRNTSVVSLNNDTLGNTPFDTGGTGGTVYVPASLISSYQTATNWSTLYSAGTCTFSAIEGSIYE